jgi:hypothetical protein
MFRVPKHGECGEMAVLLTMKENISTVIYFAALMPLRKKQEGCRLSAQRFYEVSITQQLYLMGFSGDVIPRELLRNVTKTLYMGPSNAGWKMTADTIASKI